MKLWGVTGWKNTGKTGLVTRLVREFTARGLAVSTVKHAHHGADLDQPGTDSDRHRAAGAHQVLLASPARIAVLEELRGAPEPPLAELLDRLGPADLVLIEGFKSAPHPKIETHRAATGQPLISPENPTIRAVAADTELATDLPRFDLDATGLIADFIARELAL